MDRSNLPVRGACYGYEVRSTLALNYLRSGGGDPLEIAAGDPPAAPPGELLREWLPPRFPTHVRLHADGDGYRLWIEDAGWFCVDPRAPRVLVPPGGDPVRREERLWGLPALLCFLARGDLPLHASCVQVDGRAVMLAAPGRFGKTTLAAAFAAAGHRVLAEDLVCLRPGSPPSVIPGPAMLRIRRDVADAFRLATTTELRRDEERIHLALEGARGSCQPVPLQAIALLHESDSEPRIERAHGAQVVRDLWALSFKLPTDEDRARCFQAVGALAASAATWRLTRRLRIEDLRPTLERLLDVVAVGA